MRPAEPAVSWKWVSQAIWKHKGKALLLFLAIMAAVTVGTLLSPRAYRAQSKLLVRLGRENATLDPTTTFGQSPVVAVPSTRENDLYSVAELLKSRVLLEKTVDTLGPAAILETDTEDPTDPAATALLRNRAVAYLGRNLSVDVVKKSNVISLTYDAASPEWAQTVLAKLVDLSVDYHLQLNRTSGAPEFLTLQTSQMHGQLAKSEEQLRTLKNKTGLAWTEGQRQLLVNRVGRLEDDLLQTTSTLAAAEAELKALRDKLAAARPTQETARTKGFPNVALDTMRGQLYALQLKELELIAKYSESHPEVSMLRKQIVAAKELLAKEEAGREQVTEGPNRVHEEAELAVLKQEPQVLALKAKAAVLRTQLARERVALESFNDNMLAVTRLQREVDLHETQYRKYAENLEQARIDQALRQERISNIGIMQPATAELKPVRPRTTVNLGLGLAGALLAAIGLAAALEYRTRALQRYAPQTPRLAPAGAPDLSKTA